MEDGTVRETLAGTPQGGVITPLTQKVISSSKEQLRVGEKGTHYLISVLNSNIFMAYDALDQGGKSAATERCSLSSSEQNCTFRSCAALVTRIWFVRASSLSLPGRSLPARSAHRSSRGHDGDHVEASTANGGTASEVREKQRSDHRSDRNQRLECVSAHPEKTWVSRVKRAAHFEFTLPIHLIACSSRSWRRLTTFWCPVASVQSACA